MSACSEGKESAVCQSYHMPLLTLVTKSSNISRLNLSKNLDTTFHFAGTLLIAIASMCQLNCLLPPYAMKMFY